MAIEKNLKEKLDDFFDSYEGNFQIYYIERGDKDKDGKYIYQSSYCAMGKLSETLSNDYKKALFGSIKDKEVKDFEVDSEDGESIEILKSEDVYELKNIKGMLNEFKSTRASSRDFNVKNIWGCVIAFKNKNGENIILFRKYTIPKSLQETRKLSILKRKDRKKDSSEVELIENEIISLDLKIDAFEINETMHILNKHYFHQFFNYSEAYTKFVDNSLENLKKIDIIDNLDDLCIRCKKSFNLTKKMVKIINEDKLNFIKNNISSAINVVDSHELKVDIDRSTNKIIFNKKNKLKDFMDLLCGNCVLDAIDSERGIANSVKKIPKK